MTDTDHEGADTPAQSRTSNVVTDVQLAAMTGLPVDDIRMMLDGRLPIPVELEDVIPSSRPQQASYFWEGSDVADIEARATVARERIQERRQRERDQALADAERDLREQDLERDQARAAAAGSAYRSSSSEVDERIVRERDEREALIEQTLPVGKDLDKMPWWRAIGKAFTAGSSKAPTAPRTQRRAPATPPTSTSDTVKPVSSRTKRRRGGGDVLEAEKAALGTVAIGAAAGLAATQGSPATLTRGEKRAAKAAAAAIARDERDRAKQEKTDRAQRASQGLNPKEQKAATKAAREDAAAAARAQRQADREEKKAAAAAAKAERSEAAVNAKAEKVREAEAKKAEKEHQAEVKRAEKADSKAAKRKRAEAYKTAMIRWREDVKVAKKNGVRPPRKPRRPKNDTSKPQAMDVNNAIRALATMLENAPGELTAIKAMVDEYEGTQLGEAFRRIETRMSAGNATLVAAFEPEKVFPAEVHNMLRVGQKTIDPGAALRTAVKLMDSKSDSKRKLKGEIMEPIAVGVLSLAALFATAYLVMPSFVDMYASLEMPVPPVSAAILVMSDWVVWILGGLFVFAASYGIWYAAYGRTSDSWRTTLDAYALHMPLMGKSNQAQETYQLLKVLSSYINVGSPEREALMDAAAATKNRAIKKHLLTTAELMLEGRRTFAATFDDEMFPKIARRIISIGEQAGRVQETLVDLEKTYEREAEVEAQQAVAKMSGTVAAISSLIFTVVVTMVTVPPLEMFGSTLSYGQ